MVNRILWGWGMGAKFVKIRHGATRHDTAKLGVSGKMVSVVRLIKHRFV